MAEGGVDSRLTPLAGRVALITGGGRGLGRAIAMALAEAGADVALAGRDEARLLTVTAEVGRLGRRAEAIAADVTVPDQVEQMVARACAALGRLDVLVNSAGVLVEARALEMTPADWDLVVHTNLRGTFLCAQAAARVFATSGGGKIVNIASNFAFKGVAGFAAYSATKAAIVNLTKSLAIEWARYGIQVNAIAPGFFETDLNTYVHRDAQRMEAVLRAIPQRRAGRPEELGPLAVYLASPASDFVTGATFSIDGGESAR